MRRHICQLLFTSLLFIITIDIHIAFIQPLFTHEDLLSWSIELPRSDLIKMAFHPFCGRWGYRGVIMGWDETGLEKIVIIVQLWSVLCRTTNEILLNSPKSNQPIFRILINFLQHVPLHPGWKRCTKETRRGEANQTMQFWWDNCPPTSIMFHVATDFRFVLSCHEQNTEHWIGLGLKTVLWGTKNLYVGNVVVFEY